MNYTIEGGLNFNDELNKLINGDDQCDGEVCLISGEKLEDDPISLECGHKFNYNSIYKEVRSQKRVSSDSIKLSVKQMKCPYCRNIQSKLLPHRKGFLRLLGVNYPERYCMYLFKCKYQDKNNKLCNISCNNAYCNKHLKIVSATELYNKIRCSCITKSGEQCKNRGSKYELECVDKNDAYLCKIHHKQFNTNLNLYKDGKFEDPKNIIKLI
jgi:hypothetical protein